MGMPQLHVLLCHSNVLEELYEEKLTVKYGVPASTVLLKQVTKRLSPRAKVVVQVIVPKVYKNIVRKCGQNRVKMVKIILPILSIVNLSRFVFSFVTYDTQGLVERTVYEACLLVLHIRLK